MTMEQDQEQMQGALYVAVDDGNKIIAMERSRRGDEGFRALLDELPAHGLSFSKACFTPTWPLTPQAVPVPVTIWEIRRRPNFKTAIDG